MENIKECIKEPELAHRYYCKMCGTRNLTFLELRNSYGDILVITFRCNECKKPDVWHENGKKLEIMYQEEEDVIDQLRKAFPEEKEPVCKYCGVSQTHCKNCGAPLEVHHG